MASKIYIGDITKNSIQEIWDSKELKYLYELSKEMISKESNCNKCNEFDSCRKGYGVCWKDIIGKYGIENWDFPDPRCSLAPEPINKTFIE